MNINTRNMSFVKYNGQEMQFVKFNGVVVYKASGKNLLDISNISTTKERVTYTTEDTYLKIKGNKYGAGVVTIKSGTEENPLLVLEPGTYTFSSRIINGSTEATVFLKLNGSYSIAHNSNITFTITEPLVVTTLDTGIYSDNVNIDLLLEIKLEKVVDKGK